MDLTPVHIAASVFASWRLAEIVTMDRISASFRRRFPNYFWSCPRCVSVWAGAVCTIAFVWFPWANWPLALAWLYLVEWDWRQKLQASVKMRVQVEVERLALQERDQQRRAEPSVLQARGFVVPENGR